MSTPDTNQLLVSFLNANPDVLAQLQQQQSNSRSAQSSFPQASALHVSPAQQQQLPSTQQHVQPSFQLPIANTGLIQQQQVTQPQQQSFHLSAANSLPVQQSLQLQQPPATATPLQPSLNIAPVAAQPITPYNSLNMLASLSRAGQMSEVSGGHPRASSVFSSTTTIERANQDRLRHSAVSGNSEERKPRSKKGRGAAKKAPGLTTMKTKDIEDCLVVNQNGDPVVRLEILVYPSQPSLDDRNNTELNLPMDVYYYTRQGETFRKVLSSVGRVFRFDLLLTTSVVDLFHHLHVCLEQHGYKFPPTSDASLFLPHERLPIQLLAFVGRGNTNSKAKTPRLLTSTITPTMTLKDIVEDSIKFAIPRLVVTGDNRFTLNTITRSHNVSLKVNLKQLRLGSQDSEEEHFCLSKRIYGIFKSDIDAEVDEGYGVLNEEEIEMDCVDEEEEEDVAVVAQTLLSPPNSRSFNPTLIHAPPGKLWNVQWHPPQTNDLPAFTMDDQLEHIMEIVSNLYIDKYGSDIPALRINGVNTEEQVREFKMKMEEALRNNNWTHFFSKNRLFYQSYTDNAGHDQWITSGSGVERSVMQQIFKEYLETRIFEFCIPLIDDYTTLVTSPLPSVESMPDAKRIELGMFGAVVGLSLVHGFTPSKINPLLLVFFLCQCQLASITRLLVMDLFPSLYKILTAWLVLPYNDDNLHDFQAHFINFHNLPVSALTGRTEEIHDSLGWTMLHNSIIGTVSVEHPYFQAFLRGFLLPCKGLEIDLSSIAHRFVGGASEFVLSLSETLVKDFDSLDLDFSEKLTPNTIDALRSASYAIGQREFNLRRLFRGFLEGTGIPCPLLLNDIKDHFNTSVIDLDRISERTYRMRMFLLASTASSHKIVDGKDVNVILVEDDDEFYYVGDQPEDLVTGRPSDAQIRKEFAAKGICAFKTCLKEMYIPVSYLLKLLRAQYDPQSEPANATEAIHDWLLRQIWESVGGYTTS